LITRRTEIIIDHLSEGNYAGATKPIMPRQTRCPSFTAAFTLLLTLATASPAWAWGRLGYRVISRIAENNLNPKAKAAIAELLEPGETLADASTWADEHRRQLPKTAPWHYVDVALDEPKYDKKWSADDPKKGCVVDKINDFRATLKDKTKPVEDRRFALRFLIHCVEDMHMPLHVGDNHDRGGNDTQVRFFDRGTNMHRLWDTDMIERVSKDEDFWLKELATLDSPRAVQNAGRGAVEDWATESLKAVQEAYQDPATGMRIKPGTNWGTNISTRTCPLSAIASIGLVCGWRRF
jgi:nuclease S1